MRRPGFGGAPALVLTLLALVAPGSPAAAQETPRPPERTGVREAPVAARVRAAPRPVLGVYLAEPCSMTSIEAGRCETPPVVRAVEAGGPADEAGIRPGDALVAIDGRRLVTAEGRRALGSLVEGRAVRLTLERLQGGPGTVQVVPRAMEALSATRRLRTYVRASRPGDDAPPAVREMEIDIVEVPRIAARFAPAPPHPEAAGAPGEPPLFAWRMAEGRPGVVVFLGDSAETLHVGAWTEDSMRIVVGPRPGRRGGEVLVRVPVAPPGGEALAAEALRAALAQYGGALVWENPELAGRLETIRDSVGRAVRLRLDSLHHLRVGHPPLAFAPDSVRIFYRWAFGDPTEGPGALRERAAPRAPGGRVTAGELEALLLTDARAAGAEFTPLTPGLAENFQGAKRGLLVLRVIPGTPADRVGLRDGDVVVEVAGASCATVPELRQLLSQGLRESSGVKVKWIRKGRAMEGVLTGS